MTNNIANMFGKLGMENMNNNNIANLFSQLGIKSQKEIQQKIKNALTKRRREAAKRGAATRAARRAAIMNTGPQEASRKSTRVRRQPNALKAACSMVRKKVRVKVAGKGAGKGKGKGKGAGKGKKSNGSGCSAQAGPSPLNFGLAQAGPSPFGFGSAQAGPSLFGFGSAQPRAYPNRARYLNLHERFTTQVREGKLPKPSPKQRAYLKNSYNNFILAYSMLEPNTNKNGSCAMQM